jgi:hypothetical protein
LKLIFSLFILSFKLYAGSCCGGGASTVSLITGDSETVLRSFYSNRTILADTNENSSISNRPEDQLETIETITTSISHKLTSRWQIGLSIPIVTKSREINDQWESDSGLGDISLSSAYEFYPEYTSRQFINQGFVYFSMTAPTAPSLFDAERSDLLDSRGQGHYLSTAGTLLKKRLKSQDLLLNLALTYRIGREFKKSDFSPETKTSNSLEHKISFTHIYNFSSEWSSLLSLERSFIHEQAISVFAQSDQSLILNQLVIGTNYSLDTFDVSLTYTDDFILGRSRGTILGRSIGLGFVKRI